MIWFYRLGCGSYHSRHPGWATLAQMPAVDRGSGHCTGLV